MKAHNYVKWFIILSGLLLFGCQIDNAAFKQKLEQIQAQQRQHIQNIHAAQKGQSSINDTARIVYVDMVNDKAQIFTMTPKGKDVRQLTNDPGYKSRPTWSQDHKRIAYFHYQDDRPVRQYLSINVMNAEGSNNRRIADNKKIDTKKIRLSWHPEGQIIYMQEKDFPAILFGYNISDGKQADTIRLPKQSFMTEAHTISPNLQYIAGAGPSKEDGIWHIGTIRTDGKKETDLMKMFMKVSYHLGTVVWSYNSALLVFELDKVLMVMSSRIRIDFKAYAIPPQDFDAQLSQPAFSPTGKKLAAVMEKTEEGHRGSGDAKVVSNIWVMNIDGSKQVQITNTGNCFDPHW